MAFSLGTTFTDNVPGQGNTVITRIEQTGTDTDVGNLASVSGVTVETVAGYTTITIAANRTLEINGTWTINPNIHRIVFLRAGLEGRPASFYISSTGSMVAISGNYNPNAIQGITTTELESLRRDNNNLFIEFTGLSSAWANTPNGSAHSNGRDQGAGDINIGGNIQWDGFNINTNGSIVTSDQASGFWRDSNYNVVNQGGAPAAASRRGIINQFYHGTGLVLSNVRNNTGEYLQGAAAQTNGLVRAGGIAGVTHNGKADAAIVYRDQDNSNTLFDVNGYNFTGTGSNALPLVDFVNWRHINRTPIIITNDANNSNNSNGTFRRVYFRLLQELYITANDLSGNPVNGARYFIRDTNNGNRTAFNSRDNNPDNTYTIETGPNGQISTVDGAAPVTSYIDADLPNRAEIVTAYVNQQASLSNQITTSTILPVDNRTENASWNMDIPGWSFGHQVVENTNTVMAGAGGTTLNNVFLNDPFVNTTQAILQAQYDANNSILEFNTATSTITVNGSMTLDRLYELLHFFKITNEGATDHIELPSASTQLCSANGSTLFLENDWSIALGSSGQLLRGTLLTGINISGTGTAYHAGGQLIEIDINAPMITNPRVSGNENRDDDYDVSGTLVGTLVLPINTNDIVFYTNITNTVDDPLTIQYAGGSNITIWTPTAPAPGTSTSINGVTLDYTGTGGSLVYEMTPAATTIANIVIPGNTAYYIQYQNEDGVRTVIPNVTTDDELTIEFNTAAGSAIRYDGMPITVSTTSYNRRFARQVINSTVGETITMPAPLGNSLSGVPNIDGVAQNTIAIGTTQLVNPGDKMEVIVQGSDLGNRLNSGRITTAGAQARVTAPYVQKIEDLISLNNNDFADETNYDVITPSAAGLDFDVTNVELQSHSGENRTQVIVNGRTVAQGGGELLNADGTPRIEASETPPSQLDSSEHFEVVYARRQDAPSAQAVADATGSITRAEVTTIVNAARGPEQADGTRATIQEAVDGGGSGGGYTQADRTRDNTDSQTIRRNIIKPIT